MESEELGFDSDEMDAMMALEDELPFHAICI